MTSRAYARWVGPIARDLRESRAAIVTLARQLPQDAWDRPSATAGWTCKDVLAHLAGDTGKISAAVMRPGPLEDPTLLDDNGDAANARDIAERSACSVDELIAEIEADGAEWHRLLGRLNEADQDTRWPGFPMSRGDYLRLVAAHDRGHLAQIKMAVEVIA